MGIDAWVCLPGARDCEACRFTQECRIHLPSHLGVIESSSHYIQSIHRKRDGIGCLVLYDLHGLTATQSLVKIYRFQADTGGALHTSDDFLVDLEHTLTQLIHDGRGDCVIYCDQGSEKAVPLQYRVERDNWLHSYTD